MLVPVSAAAAPGDLDPTFSEDGYLTAGTLGEIEAALGSSVTDLELDPTGKLVAALETTYPCTGFGCFQPVEPAIARFLANGSLDATFAGDGELEVQALPHAGDWLNFEIRGLAVQPDGRIVLVGSGHGASRAWIARLGVDGAPDPSFGGGDGAVTYDFFGGANSGSDELDSVAVQEAGRIIVGGTSDPNPSPSRDGRYLIAALSPAGSLDPSFSEDGWFAEDRVSDASFVAGIRLAADGRIIAVGKPFGPRIDAFAYTPDGTPDPGFSSDHELPIEVEDREAVALDSQARLLVLGNVFGTGGRYDLIRLTASGELDPSFGQGGIAAIDPPALSGVSMPRLSEIAVDEHSRPIVAGGYGPTLVGRFTEQGLIDTSFSEAGWSPAFQRKRSSEIGDVVLTSEGIVVGGGSGGDPILARRGFGTGPVDTDADGVPNAEEECPYVFGTCPKIKLRIPRLTFKRFAGVRGLHSRLVTADNNCKWNRKVRLFRKRPGRDRKLASLRSKSGGIHFERRVARHRYYVVTKRRTLAYGACPKARSAPSRPRGRRAP